AAWLRARRTGQLRQAHAIEAHGTFQRLMAQTHSEVLRTSAAAFAGVTMQAGVAQGGVVQAHMPTAQLMEPVQYAHTPVAAPTYLAQPSASAPMAPAPVQHAAYTNPAHTNGGYTNGAYTNGAHA